MCHRIILFLLCCMFNVCAETDMEQLMATMTIEQKIGQLFMVASVSDISINQMFMQRTPYQVNPDYIKNMITEYYVGGVIFLGDATQDTMHKTVHEFQQLAKIPLLIGLDAEWGVAMRVKDGRYFDKNDILGQLSNEEVFEIAQEIGKDCKELGVHINFAPVVDINTNPDNPIIGARSFGNDKDNVAQKGIAYMQGLQSVGVLSCAKHFPGHGDTNVDSHLQLPILNHNKNRLYAIEISPFIQMIKSNVPAIMMGHLSAPALDETGTPASVSKKIIQKILRDELGFDGLVITDGLGMRALTDHYESGVLELNALLAGNDILLCPVDLPKAIDCIKIAIKDGLVSIEQIDEHVRRILNAKNKVIIEK
ncbi:MAG: glycoside hydrolase family 3 protein [Candidatus Dependentiae bacterium]